MDYKLFPLVMDGARAMVFVDGENLAIRYGELLGGVPPSQAMTDWYRPGVAVWAKELSPDPASMNWTRVVRRYYFTSQTGSAEDREATVDWLKTRSIDIPRVFPRNKQRGSKQVDISLCVEMLSHAQLRHYEIAILVAGDEDYVPLVHAVQRSGARVHLWAVSSGLSRKLVRETDHFVCLDPYLGI